MSFLDIFLCPSRKSSEVFLGAASAISRLGIIEVSIVDKHFFLNPNKSGWKSCYVENIVEHKRLTYHLLVVCWETGISIVIIFAWKFSAIVQF